MSDRVPVRFKGAVVAGRWLCLTLTVKLNCRV